MYKVYKGVYLIGGNLNDLPIQRDFIRIVNKEQSIEDNYIGCYSLNGIRVDIFVQDNLNKESTIFYLSDLLLNNECMNYKDIFNLINKIKDSQEYLKLNKGRAINFRNLLTVHSSLFEITEIFLNYLYKSLLFYDDYLDDK